MQLMPAIPGSAGSGSLREELKVFRNAHLWWVYATSLLLIGATFAGFTYFVPILTEVSGFSASTVPLLLVVYGLATLVGNNIVGRLADRHTIAVLAFGLLAAIAAMVAFALFGQVPAVAVAALVVIGLTGVSMNPALVTRGARVGHNNMLVNSVHTACIMLGVMAGSWIGGLGIAEDHRGLDGIADGTGDQLLVGVGIGAQGQQADQGHRQPGGEYRDQRHAQVRAIEHPAQRWIGTRIATTTVHHGVACRLASFNTLGCTRTPLRAMESRLASKVMRGPPTLRQNMLPTLHSVPRSLMDSTGCPARLRNTCWRSRSSTTPR
ncbi:hypothetical protein OUHCRE3_50740 [Enterobacter hormaechei]